MNRLLLPATLLLATAVMAQEPPAPQNPKAALKQSLAENQAALKQYSWIETTQISLKGEVKKQEQKQCSYGADGKVQKTAMPGAPASPPKQEASGGKRGGRVKKAIVENKVDDLKDYMEKVAALVQEYVPPDPQKIQAADSAGNMSVQNATLTVKNYVKPGDQLAIGINTATKKLSSYSVNSYVEKPKEDDVTLNVTFAALPDGTAYPQQILLDAKAKKIQVKVTNSGYKKAGT